MLDDDPERIIVDPSSFEGFGEWHAETSTEDEDGVAERKSQCISREHSRETEIESVAAGLITSDVGSDGEEEDGDPKECEETLTSSRMVSYQRDSLNEMTCSTHSEFVRTRHLIPNVKV